MQTPKDLTASKKAMIFAAGLGTRLKPITNKIPKALAEVNGVTLLEILIRRLINFDYHTIVINIHHFSDQILDFLNQKKNFGIDILISNETDQLLDTGGGLQNAKHFLKSEFPILIQNVDVLTNLDYAQMEKYHLQHDALATLAVRSRISSRYLLFDNNRKLSGWKNTKTGEVIVARPNPNPKALAFSGVHFVSTEIFQYMDEVGPYSIVNKYLELATKCSIFGYQHDQDFWMDLGKPEQLNRASDFFNIYFSGQ